MEGFNKKKRIMKFSRKRRKGQKKYNMKRMKD